MSAAGQCRDCEHFDRDAGGTDGVCLDGRSWRFEVTERWDTKATDTCEFFAAKKLRDLHGEAAEARCPPYMKGVVQILREKGHAVAVRRSARNGSWYYGVDGDRERLGGPLCRIFARYGV